MAEKLVSLLVRFPHKADDGRRYEAGESREVPDHKVAGYLRPQLPHGITYYAKIDPLPPKASPKPKASDAQARAPVTSIEVDLPRAAAPEEPKAEEPAEEPKAEEPKAEEPSEAKAEEPKAEEPSEAKAAGRGKRK